MRGLYDILQRWFGSTQLSIGSGCSNVLGCGVLLMFCLFTMVAARATELFPIGNWRLQNTTYCMCCLLSYMMHCC